MATRTVSKERPVARLWVLVPPHRALGGAARLADSTVVGYVSQDADGRMQAGDSPIALLPRCQRLEIVLDAGDVFQATVQAPKLTETKLRLALPNLLEDRLLADPAQCHFAFPPQARVGKRSTESSQLPVAAVDRELLARLLEVLSSTGERPRAAFSALYVVPPPDKESLPVHVARGRLVARTGPHEGVACDLGEDDVAPAALRLALQGGGWKQIRAYGPQARLLEGIGKSLGVAVDVADPIIDVAGTGAAIDLLQGAFARGGLIGDLSRRRPTLRSWRGPLIWLGVAAAVFIAGMNVYWLKLQSEASDVRDRMASAFRSSFGNVELVDPIVQTQRELVRLRTRAGQASPSDFTALNAQVALLLAAAPVGIVAAVEYRDATLQLKFKSPPDASLQNQLRAQAVQQGLQMRFDVDGSAFVNATGG